ncbi:MAG: N-6 DNA methylase [Candidatus Heimdallarchaeota archaeon]
MEVNVVSISNPNNKKAMGQYFTPVPIAKCLVNIILDLIPREKVQGLNILDPAVGEGIFLEILLEELNSRFLATKKSTHRLLGIDIDRKSILKALELKNVQKSVRNLEIEYLVGDFFQLYDRKKNEWGFDIILGNPPHAARYSPSQWEYIRSLIPSSMNKRFPKESAIFFTVLALDSLNDGGLLGFVLPKPLLYSQRWYRLRKLILTEYKVNYVIDFGNQFALQNQEHIGLIMSKRKPDSRYIACLYDKITHSVQTLSNILVQDALLTDNFLVGVLKNERTLIRKLFSSKYRSLDVEAYRGISSGYRVQSSGLPLIEKKTMGRGFLFPSSSYVSSETPPKVLIRYLHPKIILQRILPYRTDPYSFIIYPWVDVDGNIIPHETTVIIKNPRPIFPLNVLAAILQSSLIEWWLRHVVFTKQFVTSKDLDRAYIEKIRVPLVPNEGYPFHPSSRELSLDSLDYESLLEFANQEGQYSEISLLGELYEHFIICGSKIKSIIQENLRTRPVQKKSNTYFQEFHNIYRRITRGHSDTSDMYKRIRPLLGNQNSIQRCINELTFRLYHLTSEESALLRKKF